MNLSIIYLFLIGLIVIGNIFISDYFRKKGKVSTAINYTLTAILIVLFVIFIQVSILIMKV